MSVTMATAKPVRKRQCAIITSLHFTSLHFTSLHFTSLHFTSSSLMREWYSCIVGRSRTGIYNILHPSVVLVNDQREVK